MTRRAQEIDLATLLRPVVEARWYIVIGLLVGLAAATAAFFILPRKYEAQAILTVIDQSDASVYSQMLGQFSGIASALSGGSLGTTTFADEAVAVLNSRELAERFLKKEDGIKDLFPDAWDAAAKQWKDPEEPPSPGDAWTVFDKKIRRVDKDTETGIVTITMRLRDPVKVAKWLTDFLAMADKSLRDRAMQDASVSLEHLRRKLNEAGMVDLRQSISDLTEVQLNKEMVASVQAEYAYRILDPPVVSDEDEYVSPNLLLLFVGGALAGMGGGFALQRALVLRWRLRAAAP